MSELGEARDAALRRVAWHGGRQAAANDLRTWMREHWPTITEGQRVDAVIWNSMPNTLAKVAEGEGLAAAITRSVWEHLAEPIEHEITTLGEPHRKFLRPDGTTRVEPYREGEDA